MGRYVNIRVWVVGHFMDVGLDSVLGIYMPLRVLLLC